MVRGARDCATFSWLRRQRAPAPQERFLRMPMSLHRISPLDAGSADEIRNAKKHQIDAYARTVLGDGRCGPHRRDRAVRRNRTTARNWRWRCKPPTRSVPTLDPVSGFGERAPPLFCRIIGREERGCQWPGKTRLQPCRIRGRCSNAGRKAEKRHGRIRGGAAETARIPRDSRPQPAHAAALQSLLSLRLSAPDQKRERVSCIPERNVLEALRRKERLASEPPSASPVGAP